MVVTQAATGGKRYAAISALLTLFLFLTIPQSRSNPQQTWLVFAGVTVIDSTGSPPMPDRTVVIEGNRIAAIGRSGSVSLPADAEVVNAAGKFLIPGLCDMHVHLFNHFSAGPLVEPNFPLLIANGITTVRDMWTKTGEFQQVRQWRRDFEEGSAIIPRIASAGILIDGADPVWPNADVVKTPNDARRMVRQVKATGVDFIKVYSNLSREAYFAIAEESKKQGIPFAGHVPFSVSALEASDSGQRTIEHLTETLLTCSASEKELRKVNRRVWSTRQDIRVLDSYNERKCEKLFLHFVKNDTWQVPTLVLYRRLVRSEAELINDERLKYIPAAKKEEWKSSPLKDRSAEEKDYGVRLLQANLKLVGAMRRSGVHFMAGTDAGSAVSYVYPGFSLHEELALLVEAGFTPMEALQSATRNPAQFLGTLNAIGTIEQGKVADLVLLSANPLEDINNTRKIEAVVLNGRLITKEALQKMLADAEVDGKK